MRFSDKDMMDIAFTCEISAVSWVTGSHHVLSIEHLLGQFGNSEGPVLLGPPGGQRGETRHEEVKTGEGDHVHRQLPQISIQLAGEPEAGGHPRHGEGNQMVQVTIGGGGQLQGPEN